MTSRKPTFRTADEAEVVYYEAFRHCDSQIMAALWGDDDVVCVHPGSGAIVGHAQVARSYAHIFTQAQRPDIRYSVVSRVQSEALAVHLVAEDITTGTGAVVRVLATNVYQRREQGWLMVEHHASVVQARPESATVQ